MTITETPLPNPHDTVRPAQRLSAVLCGSFHRDPERLRRLHAELRTCFDLLSPRDVRFVDPDAGFVRLSHEADMPESDIEDKHLTALRSADFVWLHAPGGYVGSSAAMEIGEAVAVGVPVFGSESPNDPVLAARVKVVPSVQAVTQSVLDENACPGRGLDRLQRYYKAAAARRGWSGESARETVLLLLEELGELARATRKLEGIARHQSDAELDVAAEIADIQLYLVHLANSLNLDLGGAVTDKERVNAKRFERSSVA